MTPDVPGRDPGLQHERTTLAWRRTGLALVAGVLLVGRLGVDTLGSAVLLPAAAALALAAWVVAATLRSSRFAWSHPVDERFGGTLTDGRLPAVVTVIVVALALGEVARTIARVLS